MTLPLWLIPIIPLAGFAANSLMGKRLGKSFVSAAGVGAAALTTLVAYSRLIPYLQGDHGVVLETYTGWIQAGDLSLDLAFRLDPLSALMLSFVTFVAFLIHVYAIGYMRHDGATDAGYARFFAYLNLFLFAMLVLVLAESFVLLFVGWEGVGLCSYLLVGYYFDREYAAAAGKKAFVVNRIGDYGFLLGMFGIFTVFGSLNFTEVFGKAAADPSRYAPALSLICLCLFLGAVGKSAQFPLYVWLPDAMAGPTPVSALIHAATMVTAGVYMIARANVLFRLAPDVMLVVAAIGCFTCIFAATIALAQNDLKRVLAYSTMSQLGYMVLACGVGAFTVGMFHVMTHAFFKACLFLGAGSVMHAMSDDLDMRHMGGLKARMPITFWTFVVATLAIAGIPPFAGFFSKDAILASAFETHQPLGKLFWFVGLLTAGLTAFYMLRAVSMTFAGKFRGTPEQAHHLHESPTSMTLPLDRPGHPRDGRRLGRPAGGFRRERQPHRAVPRADPDADRGPRGRSRGPPARDRVAPDGRLGRRGRLGPVPRLGVVREGRWPCPGADRGPVPRRLRIGGRQVPGRRALRRALRPALHRTRAHAVEGRRRPDHRRDPQRLGLPRRARRRLPPVSPDRQRPQLRAELPPGPDRAARDRRGGHGDGTPAVRAPALGDRVPAGGRCGPAASISALDGPAGPGLRPARRPPRRRRLPAALDPFRRAPARFPVPRERRLGPGPRHLVLGRDRRDLASDRAPDDDPDARGAALLPDATSRRRSGATRSPS